MLIFTKYYNFSFEQLYLWTQFSNINISIIVVGYQDILAVFWSFVTVGIFGMIKKNQD